MASPASQLSEALLTIRELRFGFPAPGDQAAWVLRIPSFDLRRGEQIALRGESGCGKTTLLNLIAGLRLPSSGSIVLEGTDLTRLGEAERDRFRARHLGYVFQTFHLLQGYTAIENVLVAMSLAGRVDRGRAAALLERVGLGDAMGRYPRELSTGQQQRVAVARAVANRPSLVLADEPTGSLDPKRSLDVLALLHEICAQEKAALLLVSHAPEVLSRCAVVRDFHEVNQLTRTVEEP